MALSFLAATSGIGTVITPPGVGTYNTGDLMVVYAFRNGSTTAPSVPAGWTSIGVNAGTTCASVVGIKVCTSNAETSGTWTNATSLVMHIYRGQKVSSPVVNSGGQTGTGTTVNYSGIVSMTDPGNSWVIRFAGMSSTDTALETPPAGHTLRTNNSTITFAEVSGFDTNAAVSSSTFAGVSVGGTSGNFITKTLEILAEPTSVADTGSYVALRIPNNRVGPMAMRRNFRQPYRSYVNTATNTITTQTVIGLARIAITSTQTVAGKSRVTATTQQTVTGKARTTVTTQQTATGRGRITKSVTQPIQGKTRIQKTNAHSHYADDFSGYTANYVKLDNCDATTGWGRANDATSVSLDTTHVKEGLGAVRASITPTATNRATISKTISSKDLSGMAKLAFWAYVADSSHSTRFQIRVGTNGSNYYEFRGTTTDNGYNYYEFVLSSPFSTTGSPSLSAVTFIQIDYFYSTGETNTFFAVDDVWSYIDTTFTNGAYTQPSASFIYGVQEIQQTNGVYELLANHTSRSGAVNHGRALHGTSALNFNANMGVRLVYLDGDAWGFRYLFDFVDGFNFGAAYISSKFNKIGIEQWTNNVRNFSEIAFTPVLGQLYDTKVSVSGNVVAIYVDGSNTLAYTMTDTRQTGSYGFESYGGTTLGDNAVAAVRNYILNENGDISGRAQVSITTTRTIQGKTRITATTPRTATGRGRVTAMGSRTQAGRARVALTSTQTIAGKARVLITTLHTAAGVARVQKLMTAIIAGVARIQKTASQTVTGKGRLTSTISQTQTGQARITTATGQAVTGLARLAKTVGQTISGQARLATTSVQTILGRARVAKTTASQVNGAARVDSKTQKALTGVARIVMPVTMPTDPTALYLQKGSTPAYGTDQSKSGLKLDDTVSGIDSIGSSLELGDSDDTTAYL